MDGCGKTECIRKWIILAIIIFVLIVIYAKSDDTPESEITAIVEAADSWGSDDLGVDKEKARYWLVKAAESNPKAMVSLALKYCVGKRTDEALALCNKAGDMSCGQTKVEADSLTAQIYGDVSFAGYDPEKQKAYLLKALNVKPAPADNGFDDEYAQAAPLLSQERNTNSPSESNVKKRGVLRGHCGCAGSGLRRQAERICDSSVGIRCMGSGCKKLQFPSAVLNSPRRNAQTVRFSGVLYGSAFHRRIVLALCAVE